MFPLRITQVAYPPRDLRFPAYVHLLARYKFPTAVSATLYAGVFPDIDLSHSLWLSCQLTREAQPQYAFV